jgi:hypothetical protein
VLAAIRPDDVNVPLFLHVLGAMLLVGTLLAVVIAIVLGWRQADAAGAQALTRFGLRIVLLGVLPAWILMRVTAQWTASAEHLPEEFDDSTWLVIGYTAADFGAPLLLVAIVLSAIALWRVRAGSGTVLGRAVGIVATVLLAAYLVAVWAMAAKPS